MVRYAHIVAVAGALVLGATTGAKAGPSVTFTQTYVLQNARLNTLATGLGTSAGTLTGTFTIRDVSGTITLLSADIIDTVTAPTTGCPGGNQCNVYTKTFIYGLTSPTATMTEGSGADPFFKLTQTVGTDSLQLEWVAASLTDNGITSFLAAQSYAYATSGTVYVTSGDAIPEPSSLAAFATGIVGLVSFGWRRAQRTVGTGMAI